MKTCSKCKVEKELTRFATDTGNKDGLYSSCKDCKNLSARVRYLKNREKELERNLIYYNKNKESRKEYRKENKNKITETNKKWYQKNKESRKKYSKENKEAIFETKKKWYQKNKEKIKKSLRDKYKTNPLFKLKVNLRNRTRIAFTHNGYSKNSKTEIILGVSWEICKAHIERQFTKGMNWDNHGDWHIDHIIPLASADTEEQIVKLCHYSNLQPLWAIDNLSKSANIIGQQNKLRI